MKKITLSFDNGPDPEVTPAVLDVLAQKGVKASFFVVGDKLRDPERLALAQRAHAEGHWIGNHTFNHLVPLGRSQHEEVTALEIGRTQDLIGGLAHEMKFFRPFGGGGNLNADLLDRNARDYLQKEGFTCVLWNVVPRDWEQPAQWVETAMQMCRAIDHPLIVLHDITTGAMAYLGEFIDQAERDGMTFVQDFPAACLPMVRGKVMFDMSPFISDHGSRAYARSEIRKDRL